MTYATELHVVDNEYEQDMQACSEIP